METPLTPQAPGAFDIDRPPRQLSQFLRIYRKACLLKGVRKTEGGLGFWDSSDVIKRGGHIETEPVKNNRNTKKAPAVRRERLKSEISTGAWDQRWYLHISFFCRISQIWFIFAKKNQYFGIEIRLYIGKCLFCLRYCFNGMGLHILSVKMLEFTQSRC